MTPSFNLWSESWITLERQDGSQEDLSIQDALLKAHEYRTLYELSPLIIVAIHRLLVAILQAIIQPQTAADLKKLWHAGRFPADEIVRFGKVYKVRFDLFSEEYPFMQSADLPLAPEKKTNAKSVGYLIQEQPAGTAVTHYNHTYDVRQQFCPACAAKGLLLIPPFASSGGAGIKPSINGVPPIYILPGGNSWFEVLTASLVTPDYQPEAATKEDTPWWQHEPIVIRKHEVKRIGYLHSLTFPARRVRLHPSHSRQPCSRCGNISEWSVATMVYEMGESRAKDAPWWRDPFAAYRTGDDRQPIPLRPLEGKAIWRDFAGLFLYAEPTSHDDTKKEAAFLRPSLLDQLGELRDENLPFRRGRYPFRTVGVRTDMKMKIFEWEEAGFDIPISVLFGPRTAKTIKQSIDFAGKCDGILKNMYQKYFGSRQAELTDATPVKGSPVIRRQMMQRYWQRLGDTFRLWLTRFEPGADDQILFEEWLQIVVRTGTAVFRETAESLNRGTSTALICEQAINHCRATLYSYRNKFKENAE